MLRTIFTTLILIAIAFRPLPTWAHGDEHQHEAPSPPVGAGGAGPDYLFPDIVPFVEEDEIYLQNWDISGSNLRVETVYANFGDGLFEIRSGNDIGGGEIEVVQRVYIDDDFGSNYEDFVIDAAINQHADHGHIHFEDFSRFSLHEMTIDDGIIGIGDEVASTLKTSYSLSANRGPLYPEYVGYPRYTSSNNGIQQRISVGYGDRYSRNTEGQFFSIDGVPTDQLYWLRQHADPDNNVLETDETNNMFEILIDLNQPGKALLRPDFTFLQPGDAESQLPGLPGDFDDDGDVDNDDWLFFAGGLGASDSSATDLDGDGVSNHVDFLIFKKLFEQRNSNTLIAESSTIVPEPASLLLLTLANLAILGCRHRSEAVNSNID